MAATNQTSNYGLPQWLGSDKLERTDMNTAMADIDNTVAAHLAESANKHITESGSNVNGEYIKFDDGTQIAWREPTIVTLTDNRWFDWVFPVTFTSHEKRFVSITGVDGISGVWTEWISSRFVANYSRIRRDAISTETTAKIVLFAIGRWK